MTKSLGIFVSSDNHLEKVINLCRAAKKRGVETTLFLTHSGTLLTQDPRFSELEGLGKLAVCNVSFRDHGLRPPVPGIGEKDYATQARNGEMIEDCDRYVVF